MATKDKIDPTATPAPEPTVSAAEPISESSPGETVADAPADPFREPSPRSAASLLVAGILGGVLGATLLAAVAIWIAPLAELNERVGALENAMGNTASRRASETNERRIAALEARLDAIKTEVERPAPPAEAPASAEVAAVVERLGRLDQSIGAGRERLDRLEQTVANRPVPLGPEAAQLSVALLVRERLRAGASVGPELASLDALGADGAATPLRPFARSGPPTAAALAAEFDKLAPDLVRAGTTDAGLGDRFAAALSNAVKVRRLDESVAVTAGDTVEALRAAVKSDSLADAEALWRKLPQPAQDASRAWHEGLSARLAAVSGADALVAAAVDRVASAARNAGARR